MPDVRLAALLGLSLLFAHAPRGETQTSDTSGLMRPGKEISLPPDQVKDTFFAYVLGIVFTGIDVDIDNAQMRDILTEFQSKLKFPFDLVSRVVQEDNPDGDGRTISLIFSGDVAIPIPYSFLGYHPGKLRSTQELHFRVTRSSYVDPRDPSVYTPVYDLALAGGSVVIDIDDWLVYLLSKVVDKLDVRHIVFFNYHREWIGLVEGRGKVFDRTMREYFSFTNNRIIYPIPAALDAMGESFIAASGPVAQQ